MATDSRPVAELIPVVRAVAEWLEAFPARGAIIGGIAVGMLGVARTTRDVDAVVWIEHGQLDNFIRAAARFGIVPRIADLLTFAAESRVLLLQHRPTGVEIDVSLAALPFEDELLDRATTHSLANFSIRLPTVEDLIVMKSIANRPRDWSDIDSLLELYPGLDSDRVRFWSNAFAEVMESPEIIEQLAQLLAKRKTSRQSSIAITSGSTAVRPKQSSTRTNSNRAAPKTATKSKRRSSDSAKQSEKKKKAPAPKTKRNSKKKAD